LSSILDVGLEGPHIAQRGFDGPDEVVVLVFDRAADVGDHCDHLLSVPQERLLPLESSTLVIRCRTQQGLLAARPLVTVCSKCACPSYWATARSALEWPGDRSATWEGRSGVKSPADSAVSTR